VVAVIASTPFLVFDGVVALRVSLVLLAALPALSGLAIARMRGRSRISGVVAAALAFAVALGIAAAKLALGH